MPAQQIYMTECDLKGGFGDLPETVFSEFPFKRSLSLDYLIEFWRDRCDCTDSIRRHECLAPIRKDLDQAKDLQGDISDLSVIDRHRDLLDLLMTAVFPSVTWEDELHAATPPMDFTPFYTSPTFRLWAPNSEQMPKANVDDLTLQYLCLLYTYKEIVESHYEMEIDFDYPIVRNIADPKTGLDRYLQVHVGTQFSRIIPIGPLPRLSEREKAQVEDQFTNLPLLMKLLPPNHFLLRGFHFLHAVDVTDQQVLSLMKKDLLERGSIVKSEQFQRLQKHFRNLLKKPEVHLSVASLTPDKVLLLNSGSREAGSCIFKNSQKLEKSRFKNSVVDQAATERKTLVLSHLNKDNARPWFEKECFENGARSLLIAPLCDEKESIGMLVLSSKKPGDLSAVNALKLREVLSIFTVALKRSLQELDNQVQAVIKEKCTAVHPTVEWKFRSVAIRYLESLETDSGKAEMEPIVFNKVYPLYAATDVRNSSSLRNSAIQKDLLGQLNAVDEILTECLGFKEMPVLREMQFRVNEMVAVVKSGLLAGDESQITEFLNQEIDSTLREIMGMHPGIKEKVAAYHAHLDQETKTYTENRRLFDSSINLLNDWITTVLDSRQSEAQSMFPHYFEKHKTDGIEHSMYIGGSLVPDNRFHPMYLKNLRLWQLLTMCDLVRELEVKKNTWPIPLETTHLIAVQHKPMSIRFRYDERKFDVDGSYNVRYEIIKKRIDKASIKKTGERLTQSGRIAIVYSHPAEENEYLQYFRYLGHLRLIKGEPERLELEDLQGIQGLKAMRLVVDTHSSSRIPDLKKVDSDTHHIHVAA